MSLPGPSLSPDDQRRIVASCPLPTRLHLSPVLPPTSLPHPCPLPSPPTFPENKQEDKPSSGGGCGGSRKGSGELAFISLASLIDPSSVATPPQTPWKLSGKHFAVTTTPSNKRLVLFSHFTERRLRPSLETGEHRSCDFISSVLWTSLLLGIWQMGSCF